MVRFYSVEGVPGTGKTTLLKNIFMNIIKKKTASVAYETFRRNMANDFIYRVKSEGVSSFDLSYVTTTHGICFRLLSSEFGYKRDDVATAKDWKEFCRKKGIPIDVSELHGIADEANDSITHISEIKSLGAQIYTLYSNCVNMLVDFDKWYTLPPSMIPIGMDLQRIDFPTIVDQWISYLERINKIDFPMMLYKTYELKLNLPTEYYLSDEFQDKTPIQFELFRMWSKDKEAVVVAFDKNQAIYGFWGTNPDFCDRVRVKSKFKILSPSWRLSQEAYEKACHLLRLSNQEVFSVKCVGDTVVREISFNQVSEIVRNSRDVMLLARTNHQLYFIAKTLVEEGIPFFGRFGWSEKQYRIYSFVWKYRNSYEPIYRSELIEYLKSVKAYPSATIEFLKKSLPPELKVDDVERFIPARCKSALNSRDPFRYTDLSDTGIEKLTLAITRNTPPRNDVFLTTIHGSKGLESDVVVVFDGITRKIHDSMRRDESDLRNEYRVWYVAMTRARKFCFIVYNLPLDYSIPFLWRVRYEVIER